MKEDLSFIRLRFKVLYVLGADSTASMNGASIDDREHYGSVPVTGGADRINPHSTEKP